MKVSRLTRHKVLEFEPVTFGVTIESEEELRILYHKLNVNYAVLSRGGYSSQYVDFKEQDFIKDTTSFYRAVKSELELRKLTKK